MNLIDNVHALKHFAEHRVVAVQVLGVLAVVADEELRATGVATGMGHGEHAAIVKLVLTRQLAIYLVAWSAVANAIGAATLNHEVRNHAMEDQSIVKSFLRQVNKILHRLGSIFFIKLNLHHTFFGMYFSYLHMKFSFQGKIMIKCISHKRVYLTKEMAETALLEARARYAYGNRTGPVAVYQCEDCGQYHLTSSGPVNEKLAEAQSSGILNRQQVAQAWIDKLKHK